MDALTVKNGFLVRLLRAVGLVKITPQGGVDHSAGADFVPDIGFKASYDPKNSLSALAAFPWPFACVQAISTDLSKVPIRLSRGKGSESETLDEHPLLDLLEQPSSRVPGTLFRRQLYTDLVLTGNAFILIAGVGGTPQALIRLHPARMAIVPLPDGQPDQYQYEGAGNVPKRYTHEQVLHIRAPSWSDDPSNLWGTGCVQPLHHDLTTEMKQSALTARTAASGQPTGILSPKEEGDRWSKEQITTLRSAYENQMQSGGSGVLILGGQAQFEKVSFTPREMEFSEVRDFVRASTLAAFDVPPARVGLPNTNYATALAQSKRYWEGLQGRAALVDAELTRLARMFGEDSISVHHDFSGVDSLQESRTERLDRVVSWSMLGVPLSDAAAYEGFDDLPYTEADDAEAEEPTEATPQGEEAPETATTGEEPLAATALNGAQIASLLQVLASVAQGSITFDAALALIGVAFPTIPEGEARRILEGAQAVPTELESPTEEEVEVEMLSLIKGIEHTAARDGTHWLVTSSADETNSVWRAYIDDIHAPLEKELALVVRRFFRGQAARIANRLPQVLAQRAVGDGTTVFRVEGDWLEELVQVYSEGQLMDKALRGELTKAFKRAIDEAYKVMPGDLAGDFTYDVKRIDDAVDAQLGSLIKGSKSVTETTKKEVGALVRQGLAEGATIHDMQQRLMKHHGFAAPRALAISRTETTKSVNAGGISAWEQQAEEAEVEVEFTWRAQPRARDAHAALNGKVRDKDGFWHSGGLKAHAPGSFVGLGDTAALNINCRCHFTPRVIL